MFIIGSELYSDIVFGGFIAVSAGGAAIFYRVGITLPLPQRGTRQRASVISEEIVDPQSTPILPIVPGNKPVFQVQGTGTQALNRAVSLEPGTYLLHYVFPPPAKRRAQYTYGHFEYKDAPSVTVRIRNVVERWPECGLTAFGEGSQTFLIKELGKYTFEVECDPSHAKFSWTVKCYRL
jgi:hypothetical protein